MMHITAKDLRDLQVAEKIIPEFGGADENTVEAIAGYMKEQLKEFLERYRGMDGDAIAAERYERFRKF